ncbi:MAG TPA: Na+/H+ antiporter NhaC family protein [Gemmatimonadaceae bacterium]|nr:Na+/H+ antiporter NhaC family protein [Gemmatimonadaceae bacterium]
MRLRLPHPLVLLLGGVAMAAVLTWVLPAGQYKRQHDPNTGRDIVVAGTYTRTAASPLGPAQTVMAVPKGIVAGAEIIVVVIFVGGAFALLDTTGALGRLVSSLTQKSARPEIIVIAVSLTFGAFGALENMHEEIIALIPALLVLSRRLGYGAVTAVAMSLGAAVVGSAFGPTNPFQTGIALRIAQMPALSQGALRFSLLGAAMTVWIMYTLAMTRRDDVRPEVSDNTEPATRRDFLLLAITVIPFVPYVYGVLEFDWGFNELSALFLVVGFAIGMISGMSVSGSAAAFLKGMETMLAASLYIGVARAISVVLTEGHVIDTIVHGLSVPLSTTHGATGAVLMIPVQALLHVVVPSVSGQAVLTMPIMAPLSDLLGFSRDAAVLAYQTGAGMSDMIIPTNGALLAILAGARLPFGRWMRFAVPGSVLVALVGLAGIFLAA